MTVHAAAPVENFVRQRTLGSAPVPLKSTSYAVDARGGFASVVLRRTFRNDEKRPIEAVMTFPVPFEAAVHSLVAEVDGRRLEGRAQARQAARETYEEAVDAGKAAVLHEELLRGLHMVSVSGLAPGAEVTVSASFAMPLSLDGNGGASLRIPVTLGQVYGVPPMVDSDAPLGGGLAAEASVEVSCDTGTAFLGGSALKDGRGAAPLDRPIEIMFAGMAPPGGKGFAPVTGRAADGSKVLLSAAPHGGGDAPLDAVLLLDASGSMDNRNSSRDEDGPTSKWNAMLCGLRDAASGAFRAGDRLEVWTFSAACTKVGVTDGAGLAEFTRRIPFDRSTTELPAAVATVTASRGEANVLLVTDGKSWGEIDVQAAIATGARFTVVLVGENSMESRVGYLAAMTGGQMFPVAASGVRAAVLAAARSMRSVGNPVQAAAERPSTLSRKVAGTLVEAEWKKAGRGAPKREGFAAAMAAYAAHLAIQGMPEGAAAKLAEEEGIVSHLTSIVLVDEEAEAVKGVPATRKVALPDPATAMSASAAGMGGLRSMSFASAPAAPLQAMLSVTPMASMDVYGGAPAGRGRSAWRGDRDALPAKGWPAGTGTGDAGYGPRFPDGGGAGPLDALSGMPSWQAPAAFFPALALMAPMVDWDRDPDGLAAGRTDSLQPHVRAAVDEASRAAEVEDLARSLGVSAVQAAVALLARAAGSRSRTAARIARALFGRADQALLDAACRVTGIAA